MALIESAYSVGVIPQSFFKLSGKIMNGGIAQKFRDLCEIHVIFPD